MGGEVLDKKKVEALEDGAFGGGGPREEKVAATEGRGLGGAVSKRTYAKGEHARRKRVNSSP